MSRGFVKEDDQEEAPIIPPRAALPPGVPNYVTPTGLEQLKTEREALERERSAQPTDNETERRRAQMLIDGKLVLLNERIHSARVLDPADQPHDEVRFGATVELKTLNGGRKGTIRKFTIVGVDEASVKDGKIAFVAPIAKAVTGKKAGEVAQFHLGGATEDLEIQSIRYA
tara:strand:+ start:1743 stop:2255 length:513 start_codon:yes stop_codon:yes gene_type:complete